MKLVRLWLVFAFTLCANSVLAQSEALDGAGYPGSDYFQTHTYQQSWDRVNDVYQAAEDRYAADQRALDAERDRRNRSARGDAAQAAVRIWYSAECRKLEEHRGGEYAAKESAQGAVVRFYTARERRPQTAKPRRQQASTAQERALQQAEMERVEQRDLPEFRSAERPTDRREMPEFVSASPTVRRALTAWEQEQERHDRAVKAIRQEISSELRRHLILKDKYRGDAELLALENKSHALLSSHYHEMLRKENARFEAASARLAE